MNLNHLFLSEVNLVEMSVNELALVVQEFSNIDSIEQFLRKNILKKSRSSFVHHFEHQQDGGAELSNIISDT